MTGWTVVFSGLQKLIMHLTGSAAKLTSGSFQMSKNDDSQIQLSKLFSLDNMRLVIKSNHANVKNIICEQRQILAFLFIPNCNEAVSTPVGNEYSTIIPVQMQLCFSIVLFLTAELF